MKTQKWHEEHNAALTRLQEKYEEGKLNKLGMWIISQLHNGEDGNVPTAMDLKLMLKWDIMTIYTNKFRPQIQSLCEKRFELYF